MAPQGIEMIDFLSQIVVCSARLDPQDLGSRAALVTTKPNLRFSPRPAIEMAPQDLEKARFGDGNGMACEAWATGSLSLQSRAAQKKLCWSRPPLRELRWDDFGA
jgi:hypothetical protein